jgi:hypothetical protein
MWRYPRRSQLSAEYTLICAFLSQVSDREHSNSKAGILLDAGLSKIIENQ